MTGFFIHTVRRRIFLAAGLLLFCAIAPQNLFSQASPAARPSNRWLLIVETSRATQPRAEAVAQIAGNLVLSGMNGQMRPGDTLGLWTFNSDLHAGSFPLQTVGADNTQIIAQRVALFVAKQKFEGRASRDKLFPLMNGVISNSEFITVILISAGGENFSGTPFDKAINAIHQQWQAQQDKARQPFLTMLRAQGGHITDFEVGLPPAPLSFPPLPPELLIPDPVVEPPAPPQPVEAAPAPIVPNLIVRGKKPEPEPAPTPPPAAPQNQDAVHSPAVATHAAIEVKTNLPTSASAVLVKPVTNLSLSSVTNPAAAGVAPEVSADGKTFWLLGAVAVVAVLGLVFGLVRRSRTQARVSLITRSLDRDKK